MNKFVLLILCYTMLMLCFYARMGRGGRSCFPQSFRCQSGRACGRQEDRRTFGVYHSLFARDNDRHNYRRHGTLLSEKSSGGRLYIGDEIDWLQNHRETSDWMAWWYRPTGTRQHGVWLLRWSMCWIRKCLKRHMLPLWLTV